MLDLLGNLQRTHSCGSLREEHVGQTVVLMGWVARKRDFGVFTFIDLRDREGITQIVVSEDFAPEAHTKAKQARSEYVIAVKGEVVARSPETVNQKIPTGKIEVLAKEILILNDSKPLPFELEKVGSQNLASEELRLKYRYLDLRRPQLQRNLMMRAQAIKKIREYMDSLGFIEIETPILLKSTPEGARDFIVPSRIYRGKFFALPQSPQILKQICMIAGFDKYYQIARCFRDEDLRADRQPEFTQLDVEMSFVNQEMVYSVIEGVFRSVFRLIDVELPEKFPRMTYNEAIERFGTDKPDLRFSMELKDLTESFKTAENIASSPFASALQNGGMVKAITVKGKADYSRKQLDELQEFVKRYGASGLTWIKFLEETQSPLAKFFSPEKLTEFAEKAEAEKGDIVLIVAGKKSVVLPALGALRIEIAKRENLIDKNTYKPVLITEFPMFEYNEESGQYEPAHHPFTSPMDEDLEFFRRAVEKDERELLGKVRAKAYDAVINGYECAGGSIRIHQREIQELNFKAIGLSPEVAKERFGFFLEALEYGAPPHGGFAAGIERICMILCGTENIRDVMAFPKTSSTQDLMMDSPGKVDESQLDELGIRIISD
ncbi:MAG: aspartate--tRNA ligase [Acidobacteria bacterium]|jgi:aspartyl-tRNA synthetase|nr:MAG: aspartate--tRNA ligase [Acidobacteriota bacterium]GIU82521.1 MAG: aspartate--tRNA(Asp/Asn) ligase [Pyrinomonadaceae bacterium]